MTNRHDRSGRGRTIVVGIAGVMLASIALLWGWNTFAADLMSLPTMRFRHALALETLLLAAAASWLIAGRLLAGHAR